MPRTRGVLLVRSAVARRIGFGFLLTVLALSLGASIVLAAALGPADISPADSWRIVVHQLSDERIFEPTWTNAEERIVWHIRVPRGVLAILVGASLSVVGAVLQAMVRNPLADPTLLGGTAGAGFGAVAVIVLGVSWLGTYSLAASAFLGALIAFSLTFALAGARGRLTPARLVLAGVAIGYVLTAATSALLFMSDSNGAFRAAMFWLAGGLGGASWDRIVIPAVPLAVGSVYLMSQARALNALLFGEETATSLGVSPERFRRVLFVVAALLTGASVALAGGVGFVGLVVPHAARLILGPDHARLLPTACLGGGLFLLWADVLARIIVQPQELPIGVITALVGAPLFGLLLARHSGLGHSL